MSPCKSPNCLLKKRGRPINDFTHTQYTYRNFSVCFSCFFKKDLGHVILIDKRHDGSFPLCRCITDKTKLRHGCGPTNPQKRWRHQIDRVTGLNIPKQHAPWIWKSLFFLKEVGFHFGSSYVIRHVSRLKFGRNKTLVNVPPSIYLSRGVNPWLFYTPYLKEKRNGRDKTNDNLRRGSKFKKLNES
jgi:hypothetical protein